jgi:hypothetical protein
LPANAVVTVIHSAKQALDAQAYLLTTKDLAGPITAGRMRDQRANDVSRVRRWASP